MDPMDDEILQASAVRFLIDGGEEDAASALLACSLSVYDSGNTWSAGDELYYSVHVELTGPRTVYDILINEDSSLRKRIYKAIEAVLPSGQYIGHFTIHAKLIDIDSDWRNELLEIARGKGINNQALQAGNALTWMNLRFRSQSEIKIAQSLDRAGTFFLPNCMGRLGQSGGRKNREADFIVCHNGKWGILEVDGEPFHPPSRTVQDHERDRFFRLHGLRVVEHFDANRCYQNPEEVVTEFLKILDNS